jgi:hypothetical protein
MSVLQPFRERTLRARLERDAGTVKFLPRLASDDVSLDSQPSHSALPRFLGAGQQVVLEAPAGSGKTVLALYITLELGLDVAYLAAPNWAPGPTHGLDDFLFAAGCDYQTALDAYDRGTLILVLDAIDEAPWAATGRSVDEAVVALSEEVSGRAGLLVTSRSRLHVPSLPGVSALASLTGIAEDQIEAFIAHYTGTRSGVSAIKEQLLDLNLPEDVRTSPLMLRHIADGPAVASIPENPVGALNAFARFELERECRKPAASGVTPVSGSWQECYSDLDRHMQFVLALVFMSGRDGTRLRQDELERLVAELLQPTTFDAYALVELSTLMTQHPLVWLIYDKQARAGEFDVQCPHDWVRTALLSELLEASSTDAQLISLDTWHKALPHFRDYAPAWDWAMSKGHLPDSLDTMNQLIATPAQAREVALWLAPQVFDHSVSNSATAGILEALLRITRWFVPQDGDLSDHLDLPALVPDALEVEGIAPQLDADMNANLSDVTFASCQLHFTASMSHRTILRRCVFDDTVINVSGEVEVILENCILNSLTVEGSEPARLKLTESTYDPKHCVLPSGICNVDDASIEVALGEMSRKAAALAEIFRRLVAAKPQVELSRPKSNVNEDNVLGHIPQRYRQYGDDLLAKLIALGYVDRKPTGPLYRLDPTATFDTIEAARFIRQPRPGGIGPMTESVLSSK